MIFFLYEVPCMKKRFFLFVCIAVLSAALLPGCARVSLQPGDVSDGESRYDDAGIKTTITSALLKKDAAKANDVNVHCFNGHVFLIGEADKDFRAVALEEARKANGVVHVTTHWFPTGTASAVEDAAIESEINLLPLFTENITTRRVAVDVWGGHVVLTGIVAKQQAINDTVARIKKIKQVRSVTSYLSSNG